MSTGSTNNLNQAGATSVAEVDKSYPVSGQGVRSESNRAGGSDDLGFSQTILNAGFITALLLAAGCLIAGVVYLLGFQNEMHQSVSQVLDPEHMKNASQSNAYSELSQLVVLAQLYLARIQLISCGVCIGMAFGFLGFALFLLGVRTTMNVESGKEMLTLKLLNISPGAFVMLCAFILIGICVTHPLPMELGPDSRTSRGSSEAKTDSNTTRPIRPHGST